MWRFKVSGLIVTGQGPIRAQKLRARLEAVSVLDGFDCRASMSLGLQTAQSRFHQHTLGTKVGSVFVPGALGYGHIRLMGHFSGQVGSPGKGARSIHLLALLGSRLQRPDEPTSYAQNSWHRGLQQFHDKDPM